MTAFWRRLVPALGVVLVVVGAAAGVLAQPVTSTLSIEVSDEPATRLRQALDEAAEARTPGRETRAGETQPIGGVR